MRGSGSYLTAILKEHRTISGRPDRALTVMETEDLSFAEKLSSAMKKQASSQNMDSYVSSPLEGDIHKSIPTEGKVRACPCFS